MATKTKKTRIKPEILLKIAMNSLIKGKLCDRFDKSHSTITIWIDKNNPMLTTVDALDIISSELESVAPDLIETY